MRFLVISVLLAALPPMSSSFVLVILDARPHYAPQAGAPQPSHLLLSTPVPSKVHPLPRLRHALANSVLLSWRSVSNALTDFRYQAAILTYRLSDSPPRNTFVYHCNNMLTVKLHVAA